MDELEGNSFIIAVNILEGRGFEFLQNPLYIEATLRCRKLETDPFLPEPNMPINTEIVWETERKHIRKLRSSHVPVRVDCLTVNEKEEKEKIGFVMLNLRNARPISCKAPVDDVPKWYRLLGFNKKLARYNPEISLTFSIRDKQQIPLLSTTRSEILPVKEFELVSPDLIPLAYLEGGIIQIGTQSPAHTMYTLRIVIIEACSLDLLLSEDMVFKQNNHIYYFVINLFRMQVNSRKLTKKFHEKITIQDEIIIHIFSNLDALNGYFQQLKCFPINFFWGQELLANSEINLDSYLNNESNKQEQVFVLQQKCEFRLTKTGLVPEGAEGRKPFLKIDILLSESGHNEKNDKILDIPMSESVERKPKQVTSKQSVKKKTKSKIKCNEIEDAAVQTSARERFAKSILSIFQNNFENLKTHVHLNSIPDELQEYHLYRLLITIISVTWRRPIDFDEIIFKFKHPRTDNSLTIHCDIKPGPSNDLIILEDVFCSAHFVSTEKNIFTLISLYPPVLSIINRAGNLKTEEVQTYAQLLSAENEDYSYISILSDFQNKKDLICNLHVNIKFTDLGKDLMLKQNQSDFDLDPYILDDSLMIKNLHDWQTWRKQQEEKFEGKLKELEEETLRNLQNDWTKKRNDLEMKLQQGLGRCAFLAEELTFATNEMKLRKMRVENKLMYDPETIQNIEMRVTQMIEEEKTMDMEKIMHEKEALHNTVSQMQLERESLLQIIEAKSRELREIKTTTLTNAQTTCLLQEVRWLEEKYFQILQEKNFFKEQWRKAAKEVHMLKEEKQQQIRLDINKRKEELSQLSIDSAEAPYEKPRCDVQNYQITKLS